MRAQPKNILVFSDLHLNEGWVAGEGQYSPREDFYFDDNLFALLRHHHDIRDEARYGGHPWLVIFNGDTFDFEQITAIPNEGEELQETCGVSTHAELGDRARFGLESTPPEARWKMRCIARGHPEFFAALGWFIAHGNDVLIIKGNHDAELHWPQVRWELRRSVLRAYRAYQRQHAEAPPLSAWDVRRHLHYERWFYYDDYLRVFVEHGNQYEPANHFSNYLEPVRRDPPPRIDRPGGMIMSRYVLNPLESSYPYIDNVRPITRALGWMFSDNPLRGTRVFLGRARDLAGGWYRVWRRSRSRQDNKRGAPAEMATDAPSPEADRGNMPAPLVADIVDTARARSRFSWQEWGGLLVDQGILGVLTLLGWAAVGMGLIKLTRPQQSRKAAQYFLTAFGLLNIGHFWSAVVNDDRRLDYMPNVATDLAQRFQRHEFPLRAVFLGHSHIARRAWLAGEQTWMVNAGTWIPTLVQQPHRWESHLTFARLASSSAANVEEPPEILEWDPQTDTARYSNRVDR